MRTLLAASLLVPFLALAQEPDQQPPDGSSAPGASTTQAPTTPAPTTRPTTPFPRLRDRQGGPTTRPGARAAATPEQPAAEGSRAPARPSAAAPAPRAPTTPAATPPGTPAAPPPAGAAGVNGTEATIRPADGKCVPMQGRFMLSFNKADIVDVLEQASRWTCRNFIYTDDVARGKITLLSKTPVTADEAYAAFLAALSANNITIYATGRYYKLGRSPDSKKLPIPTYTDPDAGVPATEQIVTKVIRLQSTDADMLRGVLGNFISPQGADIQSIPPDTLIITDSGINIRRIEKMLETIDRPGGGDLIHVVQLRYAAAKDVADKLNQIFQAQGSGRARRGVATGPVAGPTGRPPPGAAAQPAQPGAAPGGAVEVTVSKVLPDERTNKLIVIADDKSFQRVQELLEQLDVPTGGDGGVHVVFLRNASAEELATTLSSLAQGQARRTGVASVPAATPPTLPGMTYRPPTPAPASGTPEGAATAELFSGEVKITADKTQNALLVQASGSDFIAISRLIEKLDRARRQVFVEAVIMEVNLNNELDVGVGLHAFVDVDVNGKKGVLPIVSAPGTVNSLNAASVVSLGGFLTGFTGPTSGVLKDLTGLSLPSIGILLRALQSSSDVNVISTPHVLATDNEDSEITVGQNVPFQTGYFPSSLTNLLNSGASGTATGTAVGSLVGTSGVSSLAAGIQRQNVELRLKMKPQINEGGAVRLSVEVQNEEIASQDPVLGPTTSKRTVKTQIVAKDQSTIVIGGLIQERATRSVKKVPLLGSLPLLGGLFRDTQSIKQKTNLLVFLTPYIIRDEGDYRRIYEKKRKEQEDFMVQFYGKKRDYAVDIDYSRKPGPLTRLHQGVVEESARIENGGPGLPGEGLSAPPGGPGPVVPPPPSRDRSKPPPAPPPPSEVEPPDQQPQPQPPQPGGSDQPE